MITDTFNVAGFYKDPFCLGLFRLLAQNAMDYVAYKQQKLISRGSGLWESKIMALASLLSGKSTRPSSQMASSLRVITWQKRQGRSLGSLTKALISFMRAPRSRPKDLPKAPLPQTITVHVSIWHMNLGDTNLSSTFFRKKQSFFFVLS